MQSESDQAERDAGDAATVRSVLAQDDPNWRLTVVDDSGELPDEGLGDWCAGLAEPRVRYLHVEPGATEDVLATWRAVLGPAAWVASREEAVAAGWFGPVPEAHLRRVGDVVVTCHDRHVIVASRTEPPAVAQLVAYHGSYTAVEMHVPLITFRAG